MINNQDWPWVLSIIKWFSASSFLSISVFFSSFVMHTVSLSTSSDYQIELGLRFDIIHFHLESLYDYFSYLIRELEVEGGGIPIFPPELDFDPLATISSLSSVRFSFSSGYFIFRAYGCHIGHHFSLKFLYRHFLFRALLPLVCTLLILVYLHL